MSAAFILQTKLTPPPVRSDRLHRPRLMQQFSTCLEHPLTLVCAPAGYGKTTLVAKWFDSEAAAPTSMGWLSLDEDDNEPIRFLIYLVSACDRATDIRADDLAAQLHTPQPPPPKAILTALISRLEAVPHPIALVLDDYHRISAPAIHQAMTYLLDHLPSQVRLVITSREDPPLPLARYRGRGLLAEIRADELRFSREEAGQFLQRMLGTGLSADQLQDLDARTEGWIAGLQLAALALRGRNDIAQFISAFTGSHRYILDYLTEEVLSRQSETIRDFLLQTSVLSHLSGPLCNAVTGRTDGQSVLEQIERSNLFLTPLDDERYWYRYHQLFGDMLRRHLQQTHPRTVAELHHRASLWFEQNGSTGEAIEHALAGEEFDRAAELIEQRFDDSLRADGVQAFVRWMRRIPDDTVRAHVRLQLDYAFTLIAINAYSEAERHLLQAEHQLSQDDLAENTELHGLAAAVRMTFAFYLEEEADTVISSGMKALSLLPKENIRWRSWSMVVIACSYYAAKGQVAVAEGWFEQTLQLLEQSVNTHSLEPVLQNLVRLQVIQGQLEKALATAETLLQGTDQLMYRSVAHLELSKLYYERNDVQKAIHHANQGWENVHEHALNQRTEVRLAIEGYVIRARLMHLQRAEAEARAFMQQAVELVQKHDLRQTFLPAFAWQVWLWLAQGDVGAAEKWAEKIQSTTDGELDPALEFEHMTLARVYLAERRLTEAQDLLSRLVSSARDGGRMGRVISLRILEALAARMRGESRPALGALREALTLAEPEGYVRTFVDEGVPMRELLREAKSHGISETYVTRLLSAFDQNTMAAPRSSSRAAVGDAFEPLSDRELEVLHLLVAGLSNREIAQRLVISVGTVKKHLNNIFLKLDAHSRTQVIATARRYNIVKDV